MNLRRSSIMAVGVVAIACAAGGLAWRVKDPRPPGVDAPSGTHPEYRDMEWQELIPKEWDPLRHLRSGDGSLNDSDPRAQTMLQDLRAVWDNAPTVHQLDGAAIRLPGYVVPLDEVQGGLREFLLVPYFGACIHSPPPPANQIVHVIVQTPVTGFRAMDTVWVSGRMATARDDSPMGASGYRLTATAVEAYRPNAPP